MGNANGTLRQADGGSPARAVGSLSRLAALMLAATALAAETASPPASYQLFPGDLVDVRVFAQPDLSTPIRVPRNGGVDFPLIGSLEPVAGRTVQELTAEIARRLKEGYLREPAVSATVTQFGSRQVYVMGAVARPTDLEINPLGTLSAMQAIGQAGGFAADANRPGAHILRDAGDGGERQVLPLALGADAGAGDPTLQPGDVVVVPRLDRVYVLGQVARPGPFPLPEEGPLTVSKAISTAGGFERFAKQSNVQVMRDGRRLAVIDLRKVLKGQDADKDLVLEPGDTVFVPESRF